MVGDHHGEDDDDGDEDEDGKDDRGKVADDPSLTSCVHSSGGLHVCSGKRDIYAPSKDKRYLSNIPRSTSARESPAWP